MKDYRLRLLGIPLLALLITLLSDDPHRFSSWMHFLVNWSISLLFTTVLWLGNRLLWELLLQRFPGVEHTARRLWWLAVACVLYTSVASVVLLVFLHLVLPAFFPLEARTLLVQVAFNLIPTTVVQLIYESRHFFEQWLWNVRRAEQLQSAGVQSQLEALRNQLDPHFLFNSLNTLSALIEPDNEPAQQFVEQMADVYRYVLLSRDQATVPLHEELAFVETYVALHKARFRDNLRVVYHVPDAVQARHVAPLSVQLLVENALKHNVASQEQPLLLTIAYDSSTNYLTVQNPVRPRTAGLRPHTQVGLANVRRRYELLQAPQPVQVETDNGLFTVRLPLLSITPTTHPLPTR
ncbi:histidine kinase [Hymenobacter sp. NBH84]|uniref:sensor histidine kinase n=1 Tax=Hymenobacter sp. NBH84 TaxID=2596915 RepID=UPI00162A810C|nr:histidine kinase [Hymenobacter sp. NBH84]QNE38844.1 histidine kinase [Hymenobacter sp. NBH84]